MLPHPQALDGSFAESAGQARNGANWIASGQVVRGETDFGRRHRRSSGDYQCGVGRVFVLVRRRSDPLMPYHQARARTFLKMGCAVVARFNLFTIRLRDRTGGKSQALDRIIDPWSRRTGLTLVRNGGEVPSLADIEHRGARIHKSMQQWASYRMHLRSANLRYRNKRSPNRRSRWPPSAVAAVVGGQMLSWTRRFRALGPVTGIQWETVRFDMQKLESPDIEGVECRQGTLVRYEVREFLLDKRGRKTAFCDSTETPLHVDQIRPKAQGGSDRVSNLTLACPYCNRIKGGEPMDIFLSGQPDRLRQILSDAKAPLRDAAAVNATRRVLCSTGCAARACLFPASRAHGRSSTGRGWESRRRMPWTRLASGRRTRFRAGTSPCSRSRQWAGDHIRARGRTGSDSPRVVHLPAEKSVRSFRMGAIARATAHGKAAGRPYRARRGAGLRLLQRPNCRRHRPGRLAQPLPYRLARRQVRLKPRHFPQEGECAETWNDQHRIPPRPEGRGFLRV